MQDFKKLDVWKKSYKLATEIYTATLTFPKDEMYGMVSQMRRAATSIPANIAEGCGRYTSGDLAHFLDISMGSISELEFFLLFARDLNYVTQDTYAVLDASMVEIRRMLIALIQTVRKSTK